MKTVFFIASSIQSSFMHGQNVQQDFRCFCVRSWHNVNGNKHVWQNDLWSCYFYALLFVTWAQHSHTICQLRRYMLCIIWLDVVCHRLVYVYKRLSSPFTDINIYRCYNYRWLLWNWMVFSHMCAQHTPFLWEDLSVWRYEGKWAWYVIKNVKSLSRCHSLLSMHIYPIYYVVYANCVACVRECIKTSKSCH